MHEDIERVLIDEEVIRHRLDILAEKITAEIQSPEITVVVLLKGAVLFMADLLRKLPLTMQIECLNVASYHGGMESSGKVEFLDAKLPDVKGKTVLLLDDILDTGRTLEAVIEKLRTQGAA